MHTGRSTEAPRLLFLAGMTAPDGQEPLHTFRTGRVIVRPSRPIEFPTAVQASMRRSAASIPVLELDEAGNPAAAAPKLPVIARIIRSTNAAMTADDFTFEAAGMPSRRRGTLVAAMLVTPFAFAAVAAAGWFVGLGGSLHATPTALRGVELAVPMTAAVAAATEAHDAPAPVATARSAIEPSALTAPATPSVRAVGLRDEVAGEARGHESSARETPTREIAPIHTAIASHANAPSQATGAAAPHAQSHAPHAPTQAATSSASHASSHALKSHAKKAHPSR